MGYPLVGYRDARNLIFGAVAGSFCAATALSATIESLHITRDHGRYHLVAHTHLNATPTAIYTVLTTYDHNAYHRISAIYKESRYLAPDSDGTPLVYTRVEGCLVFYCRSMRRVERLDVVKPTFIRTTALPSRSDFRYSRSQWRLKAVDDGTEVVYRLDMEPDFWLPPFVGPWFLRRILLRGGIHAVQHIERLAQQLEQRKSTNAARSAANAPGASGRAVNNR